MTHLIAVCNETHRTARADLDTDGTTWWVKPDHLPGWVNVVSANYAVHQAVHQKEDTYADTRLGVTYHVVVRTGAWSFTRTSA